MKIWINNSPPICPWAIILRYVLAQELACPSSFSPHRYDKPIHASDVIETTPEEVMLNMLPISEALVHPLS